MLHLKKERVLKKKTEMKKFKQKTYTIQEGHYTGPKDLEKIPGSFKVIRNTVTGGAAVGGVVGGVLKKTGIYEDTGVWDGAKVGGKTGFWAGVATKILLNALHKPMKKVKYQEVDKLLRAKFGVYRVSGFTAGDTMARRKEIAEKFGFNDRKVTDYKISFAIRDNQVTMYTLGLTDEELDKLNFSLDYYCKKFSGMEYTSKPINTKSNSYSVTITFTNYQAIADFIFEVSEETGLKINLLDSDALLERAEEEESEKTYSVFLDKYDIFRTIFRGSSAGMFLSLNVSGPRDAWSSFVSGILLEGLSKIRDQELAKIFPSARKNFGSSYLKDRIDAVGGIEGMNYTVGAKNCESNIRLDRGVFMVSSLLHSLSDKYWNSVLPKERRKEVKGKVSLWTLPISNRLEFDGILKGAVKSGIKPNIFI